jgi:hypothetical protein
VYIPPSAPPIPNTYMCAYRLNSRQLLRTIAHNEIDDVYASIFDVHVYDDDGNHSGDERVSITRTPSLAMMEMGDRDGEHGSVSGLPPPSPPLLPVVQFF